MRSLLVVKPHYHNSRMLKPGDIYTPEDQRLVDLLIYAQCATLAEQEQEKPAQGPENIENQAENAQEGSDFEQQKQPARRGRRKKLKLQKHENREDQ